MVTDGVLQPGDGHGTGGEEEARPAAHLVTLLHEELRQEGPEVAQCGQAQPGQ